MALRIGEMLVREQLITPLQLQEAVRHQKANGGKIGLILVKLGYVKDQDITALLSRQYGVPSVKLSEFDIDEAVIELIPPETARKYQVVPINRFGSTLTIAMTDPTNVFAMDDIKFMTGYSLESVVASEAAVIDAIGKYYPGRSGGNGHGDTSTASTLEIATRELADMPQVLEDDLEILEDVDELDVVTLERQGGEAPIVRLVNVILASAIHKGASDIHVEPYEKEFRVRFRIDGVLYNVMAPPLRMKDAVTSRLKIMAKMDIAEKRLPQDGRIKMRFSDAGTTREIDLRVSSLPTLFGEKLVLRLLDRSQLMLDMTALGFEAEALASFQESIHRPWGMVLVTGPTGSGKTNTLYSSISGINTPDTNIMTAEDPVEFNLAGVNQVQIRESIGLSFAAALRSFLRQDPNILLVGEIRDFETAEVAVKAALTGHLVLSTLHTNDAPSSMTRLINMGIEPFLVASSVNLICAQRLVRRICSNCAEPSTVPHETLLLLGFEEDEVGALHLMSGRGCARCNDTGYRGRVGLFEVMVVSDVMRELIVKGVSSQELRHQALQEGMVSLRDSGLRKIAAGQTTVQEVTRETSQ